MVGSVDDNVSPTPNSRMFCRDDYSDPRHLVRTQSGASAIMKGWKTCEAGLGCTEEVQSCEIEIRIPSLLMP